MRKQHIELQLDRQISEDEEEEEDEKDKFEYETEEEEVDELDPGYQLMLIQQKEQEEKILKKTAAA